MNDTFMKEKPILPLILSMSLPMVLSMLVNSLYNIVDSFFVAQISEEAMTALSLVYPVQNFINAVGIGFGVGINAVIAFHLGAGDHGKADQAAAVRYPKRNKPGVRNTRAKDSTEHTRPCDRRHGRISPRFRNKNRSSKEDTATALHPVRRGCGACHGFCKGNRNGNSRDAGGIWPNA